MTSCYYAQRLAPPGWTSLARSFERSLRGERRSERTIIIESYSEVPEPSPRFLNCAAPALQQRGRDGRRWPLGVLAWKFCHVFRSAMQTMVS